MTDEQRPWQEWPEWMLISPTYDIQKDALCARVWREAQEAEAIGNSADFQMVIRHCAEIYDEVTRGRISKPNTLPSEVISVMEELNQQDIDEAVQAERTRADAAEAQRDRLAAALRECRQYFGLVPIEARFEHENRLMRTIDAALADVPAYTERLNAQTGYNLTEERRRALYPLPHDLADVREDG